MALRPWEGDPQSRGHSTVRTPRGALREGLKGALAVLRRIVWGAAVGLRRALPSRPLGASGLPGLVQRFLKFARPAGRFRSEPAP